jgi:hypothetical protein
MALLSLPGTMLLVDDSASARPAGTAVCNLYSITTNQAAILALFRLINRSFGNLPPMPGVFPDYPVPVVRNVGAGREMVLMRWGIPPPPRTGGPPVTNIRNTSSPHWCMRLKPENRCFVPTNSFAEYAPEPNPETKKKDVIWFALKARGYLDRVQGRPWHQIEADPRESRKIHRDRQLQCRTDSAFEKIRTFSTKE